MGLAFLAAVAPEDLTAVLLDPDEDPPEIVLLLPHGGETARRTVRAPPPDPESRLPRLGLVLDRLRAEGRVKVRLLLEEPPRRLDVLGVLMVGVFTAGARAVRDGLVERLVVPGRR